MSSRWLPHFATIIRHAYASSNAEQLSGYIRREWDHYPLTDTWEQQAQRAWEHLRDSFDWSVAPVIFVSSPALRAQQTCAIIRDILGFTSHTIHSDARLRERRWGQWEGRLQKEVMTPQVLHAIDDSRGMFAPPWGDSPCMIADNTLSWLSDISRARHVFHIVVSHGFTIRSILANVHSIHPWDIHGDRTGRVSSVSNAGIITLDRSEKGLKVGYDQRKAQFLPENIRSEW